VYPGAHGGSGFLLLQAEAAFFGTDSADSFLGTDSGFLGGDSFLGTDSGFLGGDSFLGAGVGSFLGGDFFLGTDSGFLGGDDSFLGAGGQKGLSVIL
jgi:hypothetical protein